MRLIDVEKLEKYKADCCVPLTEWQEGWNDAIDMIMNETPTVDAEPVVRCDDCIYRDGKTPVQDLKIALSASVIGDGRWTIMATGTIMGQVKPNEE